MSVELYINHRPMHINPVELPQPSSKSLELFKKALGEAEVPTCFTGLQGRLETLGKKQDQLRTMQANSIKDKIFAFLATAFLIGVLVAGITMLAVGPPGLNIGIGGSLLSLYVILTEMYNQSFNDSKQVIYNDMNPINFLKVLILGPFIPIYQSFNKAPHLTHEINQLDKDLGDEFKKIHEFYTKNKDTLENHLKNEPDGKEALEELKKGSEYFAKFVGS